MIPIGSVFARQCTESDHEFWTSYGETFSNFLAGCAKKESADAKKTSQCLLDDPMNKLSGSCAACFGDFPACAKDECWYQCLWDSASDWCLGCIYSSKCPGELVACSGYAIADLPPKPSTSIENLPTTTMPPTTSTATTIQEPTTEATTSTQATNTEATTSTSTTTSTQPPTTEATTST
ncbi:hypothetical protein FOL47_003161, partial [Perkinsus chesapeaki]